MNARNLYDSLWFRYGSARVWFGVSAWMIVAGAVLLALLVFFG